MKKSDLKSVVPLNEGAKNSAEQSNDWKTVLIEIILKILTLGFYHIEKHKKQ
jgi:hypothetical protein